MCHGCTWACAARPPHTCSRSSSIAPVRRQRDPTVKEFQQKDLRSRGLENAHAGPAGSGARGPKPPPAHHAPTAARPLALHIRVEGRRSALDVARAASTARSTRCQAARCRIAARNRPRRTRPTPSRQCRAAATGSLLRRHSHRTGSWSSSVRNRYAPRPRCRPIIRRQDCAESERLARRFPRTRQTSWPAR